MEKRSKRELAEGKEGKKRGTNEQMNERRMSEGNTVGKKAVYLA